MQRRPERYENGVDAVPVGRGRGVIKVLIVEDSAVVRQLLVHLLGSDPSIRVVGTAHDGEEALALVARERPDVITMDIHMPRLDGLEATRRIMQSHPTPIVVVSGSSDPDETATTFRAIEAGALALVPRPVAIEHPDHVATARELVQTVKLMSEVRVVRRWPRGPRAVDRRAPATTVFSAKTEVRIVALGASTGGPPILQTILSGLPRDFPAAVVIVQHMAAGFVEGFVSWLGQTSAMPVHVPRQGEALLPGHAYVAPDGRQMQVERGNRIRLTADPPENSHRPSVSTLFRSVAEVYGPLAAAGLLTGMGRDGADELKVLRDKGAITFAQDPASSVVYGMPGEAVRLEAAMYVLSPEGIAAALVSIASERE